MNGKKRFKGRGDGSDRNGAKMIESIFNFWCTTMSPLFPYTSLLMPKVIYGNSRVISLFCHGNGNLTLR